MTRAPKGQVDWALARAQGEVSTILAAEVEALRANLGKVERLPSRWREAIGSLLSAPAREQCALELEAALADAR